MENSVLYSVRSISDIPIENTSYPFVRTEEERRAEMDRLLDVLPCEMVEEAAMAMLAEPEFSEGYEGDEIARYERAKAEFRSRVGSEDPNVGIWMTDNRNLRSLYLAELKRVELRRMAATMSDDLLIDSGIEVLCSAALLNIPEYLTAAEMEYLRMRTILPEIDANPVLVEAREGLSIWLEFSDGVKGELDMSPHAGSGSFSAWNDRGFFEGVHIDEFGFVTWGDAVPGDPTTELDFDSGVLYARLLGLTLDEIKGFDEKAAFSAEIERRRERSQAQ